MTIPDVPCYWLANAHVPQSLLTTNDTRLLQGSQPDGLVAVDLCIRDGLIIQVLPAGEHSQSGIPVVNWRGGQVWPCFVDMHTHLDKGHVWSRTPNPDGTFAGAATAAQADWERMAQVYQGDPKRFQEDVRRRLEFGLKCSYAHGTQAIRTHISCSSPQTIANLEIFAHLQKEWAGRLTLQAVTILYLDSFMTPAGEHLADRVADLNGLLGGVTQPGPDLDRHLDRVFDLAQERGLDLDFHCDESGDPQAQTLRHVAAAVLRHNFAGRVVCGHCCSLAVQPEAEVQKTLQLVKTAGIGIVSLPMCNLFLQDRQPQRTPRWRGITLIQELHSAGIPVAVASDNCRDPFYGFGDHDGLEVFTQAVRIGHLDTPYGQWPQAITKTPAHLMNLGDTGQIGVGCSADLVLFKGRGFSELLSRSQHDRLVLRRGKPIDTSLPDYRELDDLMALWGTPNPFGN
ncbi:MAG: cytosine deaminase [Cyanobacteriota bacterium]|nr:cytosine deaminase [Cyanobacteriota bacterium]